MELIPCAGHAYEENPGLTELSKSRGQTFTTLNM